MLALRREVLVESVVGWLALLFVVPSRYRTFTVAIGAIAAASILGLIATSERWQERLYSETRQDFETGIDPRTVLLVNTPHAMLRSPVLGHGPDSYRAVMRDYFPSESYFDLIGGIAPHNSFSRAAVETGIPGFLSFTWMIAALGLTIVFQSQNSPLRLTTMMVFLHVGDWLFFGDGIQANATWYFIGVLLYCERQLSQSGRDAAPAGNRQVRSQQAVAGRYR
jgi:O-antigen ligase